MLVGELAALLLEVPCTPGPLLRHPPLHIAELSGQQAGQEWAGRAAPGLDQACPCPWFPHQHVEEVPGSLELRKHLELFRGKEQTTAHTPTLGAQAFGNAVSISTYE